MGIRSIMAGSRWGMCLYFVAAVLINTANNSILSPSAIQQTTDALNVYRTSSSHPAQHENLALVVDPESATPPSFENIWFEHFSGDHLLSVGTLYCVIQDHYGYLWLGGNKGLARYDGYHLKVYDYDPNNPQSLSSNNVYALLEDRSGTLWIGTYGGGLEKFDRDQDAFIHYQHDPSHPGSISDDKITTLHQDDTGQIWIGTSGGGLNRFDPSSGLFDHFRYDPDNATSISSDVVNKIYQDNLGTLWLGTSAGLNRFDRTSNEFTRFVNEPFDSNSLGGNQVYGIVQDRGGDLWIGTYDGGLSRFNPRTGKFQHYLNNPLNQFSLSSNNIYTMMIDHWGYIWIGTMGGGLNLVDPFTEKIYRYMHDPSDSQSLSSNFVNVLYEDMEGALWIGTTVSLDRYDPNKPKFNLQFSHNHIFSLYESRYGMLWIGALDGLYRFDRQIDQVTHYRHVPGDVNSLSEWWVTSIAEDRSGWLWIGTAGGGLNRLDTTASHFAHYRHDPRQPNSLSSDMVNTVYVDRTNTLWIGTVNGLNEFDSSDGSFIHYSLATTGNDPAGTDIIKAILEDSQGYLWVGTQGGGLKRFNQSKDELVTYRYNPSDPDSLRNNVINVVYEDSHQRIWVGSESGLHLFDRDTGTFKHFGKNDGLLDDNIDAILEDGTGNLWIGTDIGLSKLNPQTEEFKNIDTRDGLHANQFSGAAFQDDNGEMYFGGINGITTFFPDQIQENPFPPPLVLLSIKQDGQPVPSDKSYDEIDSVVLSGARNDYEFELAALSYSQPEKNQYAYMLSGVDSDWNYLGTDRVVHLTDLPGGTYTLHFKGTNDDGVWNEARRTIQFTIVPPFWETAWFRGLFLLIVTGSITGGYIIRVKSIAARNKELQDLIEERTCEIDRHRQELDALYRADALMHRSLHLEQVLQALVDVAVDILSADKSAVFTWHEDAKVLVMRVTRGFNLDNIDRFTCSLQEGMLGRVVSRGEPLIVDDMHDSQYQETEQPACYRAFLEENVNSLIFLPIWIASEVFGVFAVCFTRSHAFGEEEIRLFSALSQRAGLAIENAQLYESAQLLAVIEERSRLARDLHDSVKQNTFAALAQLSSASRLLDHDPTAAQVPVSTAEDLMHDVLLELNTMIQEMYPLALKERGLAAAVRAYVNDWCDHHTAQVALNISSMPMISLDKAQALYRITQEALSNVSRHSQATSVVVELRGSQHKIELLVEDDGCGFDLKEAPFGFGLRSMRERVERLAGLFHIESALGCGTRLSIEIPA